MNATHWDRVYNEKDVQKVSWYQNKHTLSTQLIGKYNTQTSRVIDCGSGASTLVDELLHLQYTNITLLDISDTALQIVKNRIGNTATFIASDILDFQTNTLFDVWHDRAVLHFLTKEQDCKKYFEILASSVTTGGVAIIATFAPDKVRQCSNLNTKAYDAQTMQHLTQHHWKLLEILEEKHQTPNGDMQLFNYFYLQRL
jgi:trans-aconitate methyltransferase